MTQEHYPAHHYAALRKLPAARGRTVRRQAGEMNGTEREYANIFLEPAKRAGEIAEYWFERFTFKLADDCRYTPDFVVLRSNGLLECHEVKGSFFEEDAKVKIRVAAELFPFRFILAQKRAKKDGGGWIEKEYGAKGVEDSTQIPPLTVAL